MAILAVLAMAPVGVSAGTSPKTVTNTTGGYKFQVPMDWASQSGQGASDEMYVASDSASNVDVSTLTPDASDAPLTPSALTSLAMQAVVKLSQSPSTGRTGYSAGTATTVKVPGADAAMSNTATYTDNTGTPKTEYMLVAAHGNSVYSVLVFFPTSLGDAGKSTAQSIINSFQISGS